MGGVGEFLKKEICGGEGFHSNAVEPVGMRQRPFKDGL